MEPMDSWRDIARLRRADQFGFSNGGWAYDAYPDLPTLDAGTAMPVASIEGPGGVRFFHSTMHLLKEGAVPIPEGIAMGARGVILEVYYNGASEPAVRVPLADFFGDGCCGQAAYFTSARIEKAPRAYNCFFPMPFEKSIEIVLRNDTPHNLMNYSFVEFERLDQWRPDELGYFHATWRRWPFQLTPETNEVFFRAEGRGHLAGRHWSVVTDEPQFEGMWYIMEANNEVRVDDEATPRADYLGSEDSFAMSWGWPQTFAGLWNGANVVQERSPSMVSAYRFYHGAPIAFDKNLEWRVNWTHEYVFHHVQEYLDRVAAGGCWVDYATTHYWYQEEPGHDHAPLLPLDERIKPVLRPNPLNNDEATRTG